MTGRKPSVYRTWRSATGPIPRMPLRPRLAQQSPRSFLDRDEYLIDQDPLRAVPTRSSRLPLWPGVAGGESNRSYYCPAGSGEQHRPIAHNYMGGDQIRQNTLALDQAWVVGPFRFSHSALALAVIRARC